MAPGIRKRVFNELFNPAGEGYLFSEHSLTQAVHVMNLLPVGTLFLRMKYHIFQDILKKWRWYLTKGKDRISTGEGCISRSLCEEDMRDNRASAAAPVEVLDSRIP